MCVVGDLAAVVVEPQEVSNETVSGSDTLLHVLVRVALKHNLTEQETGNVTLVSEQGKRLGIYGSYS